MSYAKSVNARFYKTSDIYVNVLERINQLLDINPEKKVLESRLENALAKWKRNNKSLVKDPDKFFSELPEALTCKLSDIYIDVTLQRYVYFDKIVEILVNYEGINVQAIRVYRDSESHKLVCWDGQHTLIALYMIIVRALRLNPADIDIPIVISKGTQKSDARRSSLNENGPGKNPFDKFDNFEQEVYGVRIDGSKDEKWSITELKQQYLEENDMFLANERMFNTGQPGALPRYDEITDPDYDPEITKWFATWCKELNGANRPFYGTEVAFMYYFFDKCVKDSKVKVDLSYVMDVAEVSKRVTGNDFDGTIFYQRVRDSYGDHLKKEAKLFQKSTGYMPGYMNLDGSVNGNTLNARKNDRMLTFFCAMLESKGIKTPKRDNEWKVPKKDLF